MQHLREELAEANKLLNFHRKQSVEMRRVIRSLEEYIQGLDPGTKITYRPVGFTSSALLSASWTKALV